jgi:hypothetical protein
MTHPTMHGQQQAEPEPEASEEELLATLDVESEE